MAILKVALELVKDERVFYAIVNAFDTIEDLGYDPVYHAKTLRVRNTEVPEGDTVIEPVLYKFDGVDPFIIDFGK